MVFFALAIVAGIVIGRLLGGRVGTLGEVTFRTWPLLFAGVVAQIGSEVFDRAGLALLLLSYVLLLAFAAANLTRVGMGLVLVGIFLNVAVIAVNGGMPVRAAAIRAAGGHMRDITFDHKHHLETSHDRLTPLGDIIPVPFARQILSFGDLVMSVGIADVVVHLMRERRRADDRTPTRRSPAAFGSTDND